MGQAQLLQDMAADISTRREQTISQLVSGWPSELESFEVIIDEAVEEEQEEEQS